MNVRMTPALALLTLFTSARKPLAKRFTLKDGKLQKEAVADFYKGQAETLAAPTAEALENILSGLTQMQAVSSGRLKGRDKATISSRKNATATDATRSKRDMEFSSGPGWLVWDYDSKSMPPEVRARVEALGGPVEAFYHLWPEARGAAQLIRPSSSDGIAAPGAGEIRSDGLHGFFRVEDVSRSRDILDTLQARAWTAGLAWIALSSSGSMLVRSIVDVSVGSPERLIFEALPILGPGVTRNARPAFRREAFDDVAAPELTADVQEAAQAAEREARNRIKPEAEKAESSFVAKRAKVLADKNGTTIKIATGTVRRMLRGGVLADSHYLEMPDGSFARVGDILDHPEQFDRMGIPDPVEGIDYGTNKATLLLRPRPGFPDDKPILRSHAHGMATVYRFERYENPPPPPIDPVHPAPEKGTSRAEQMARAENVQRHWDRASRNAIRAMKWVAAQEVERLPDLPDAEAPEDLRKAAQRDRARVRKEIRTEAKARFGLDSLPRSKWSENWTGPREMLTGAQGIGKTAAWVGQDRKGDRPTKPGMLHDGIGMVTLYLSPDHGKNRENLNTYSATMPTDRPTPQPVEVRGRDAARPNDAKQTMCRLSEQTAKAAKRGVNIRQAFCAECPFRAECGEFGYLRQEKELEQAAQNPHGAVIFAPHDYAAVNIPGGITPDRVIFDECPRDHFKRTASVPVEDWGQDLRQFLNWTGQKEARTADALSDLLTLINPLRTAVLRGVVDAPSTALALIEAKAAEMGKGQAKPGDVVRAAANALSNFLDQRLEDEIRNELMAGQMTLSIGRGPGRPPKLETRLDRILDGAGERHGRAMIEIFRVIAAELDNGAGPRLTAVQRMTTDKRDCIVADYLAPMTLPRHGPLLYIDGTGQADLAAAWFGELLHHHCPVERLGTAIFVAGNTFSTSNLTGEPAARSTELRAKLAEGLANHPNAALVLPKKVRELIGEQGGRVVMHYGALRGRNDAQNCPEIITVGRTLPQVRELERIGRAFAVALGRGFDALDGNSYPEARTEGLRMRNGSGHGIKVQYHPDPTGQAVLRQIRDAEATQAVDRVRPHFEDKAIIVMGSCVPDVTFDRIEQFPDWYKGGSAVERAWGRSRCLLLSPAENILAFPDLWKNKSAIKRDTQFHALREIFEVNELGVQNVISNILITLCTPNSPAVLATYQRPQKAGAGRPPAMHMAIVRADPEAARAVLEKLTGPLAAFRIEAMNDAAQAEEDRIMREAREAAETSEPETTDEYGSALPEHSGTGSTVISAPFGRVRGNVPPWRRMAEPPG